MKKSTIISIIALVIVVAVVIISVVIINSKPKAQEGDTNQSTQTTVNFSNVEKMKEAVTQINEKLEGEFPRLMVKDVDVSDTDAVTSYTGLKSAGGVEAVVVSEPMMSSQAYSFVLVKTSKNANIENMKKEMLENIDTRKWICVCADNVFVTNYEDVICLVMASEEWAKPAYNQFKNFVGGKVGTELEKTAQL